MSSFNQEDIFSYLDQSMTPEKLQQFKKQLNSDPELKAAVDEARTAHEYFKNNALEKAPAPLADQVMTRISETAKTKYYRPSGLFSSTGFLLVSGIITALVAFLSLISSGYLDLSSVMPGLFENSTALSNLSENFFITKRTITNSLVVIYGVLALVVLDKFVFNPFFKKRVKRLGYH